MDRNPEQSRRSIIRTIGAAGIGIGTLSSSVGASRGRPALSKRDAKKAARRLVDEIGAREGYDDWRGRGVRRPELFMARIENGQRTALEPRAWVFPIEHRGEDVGYLTIDATLSEPLVLAYGRDRAPQRQYEEAEASANVRGLSAQRTFIYQGGTEFGIATREDAYVDLRGNYARNKSPAKSRAALSPRNDTQRKHARRVAASRSDASLEDLGPADDPVTISKDKGDGPSDWDRSTDEEIYGVPNWTESDYGGASTTSYGNGRDSWDSWDGCVPIASSMVIGYHEPIYEFQEDAKNELIDHLHDIHDTNDAGNTGPLDLDNVANYSRGYHSYGANRDMLGIPSTIHDYVQNDNPTVLAMQDGPYTDAIDNGHAVTVVGYDHVDDRWGFDDHYYKVHNGYDGSPDKVVHGAWDVAYLTRIWTQ